MTDPWSRDEGARSERGPLFEIPLEGDGPLVESSAASDGLPNEAPNWRKVVGIASIAGVVLGILVAIAFLVLDGDDDDAGQATGTTVEPTGLTTPPTLAPLEVLPPPSRSDSTETSMFSDPTDIGAPREYEAVSEDRADIPADLLKGAIAALGEDLPRRAAISYVSTANDGAILNMKITSDPNTDRYLIEFSPDSGDDIETEFTVIVDMAAGYIYQSDSADSGAVRQSIQGAGELPGGFTDLGDLLDALLLGPLRPDTFTGGASVEPGPLVSLVRTGVTDVFARQFLVEFSAAAIPEWATFAFGPFVGAAIDDDQTVRYEVYIDDSGSIVLTQGANPVEDGSQWFVHSLETLDPSYTIGLPPEDQVTDFDDSLNGVDEQASSEGLRPVYETVPVSNEVDVSAAIAQLALEPPVRSVVTDINRSARFTITSEFDAASGRTATTYQLSDPGNLVINEIEDLATNLVYRQNRQDDRWVSESLDARGSATDERYLTGLISPDLLGRSPSLPTAPAEAAGFVLEDGTVTREFEFTVDATEVDLPIDVALQLLLEQPVTVYVYVDAQNRVVEQQVLSNSDGSPEVLIQRFVYVDDPPVVTLPDPADVVEL